jgi:hypothetical protein
MSGDAGFNAVETFACGGWMAFGLAMGIRSALIEVYTTTEHLAVKNFWSTRKFRRIEIRAVGRPGRFRRRHSIANLHNGLLIYLDEVRVVVATASSPAGWIRPISPIL